MFYKLVNYLSSGLIVLFILLIPESCSFSSDRPLLKSGHTGGLLKDIQTRGTLVALTDDNSFNYFEFEGEPHGYQYDLLREFADHLGVSLEIVVEPNVTRALQYLQQRRVDIVAMELPVINDKKFDLVYTTPLYYDYQVLVKKKQIKRHDSHLMSNSGSSSIDGIEELKNKTITLSANKLGQIYLSDIQHANSNETNIIAEDNLPLNELFEEVSEGTIDYTISFERPAKAMMLAMGNIDAQTRISPEIGISWIVRKGAVNLLEVANNWIEENKSTRLFAGLNSKYYKNPRWVNIALGRPVKKSAISDYDNIIREMSNNIGWDWRLVAALIYHESKFQPDATSRRGAFGLMQLMPSTAYRFGAHEGSTASEQVAAGTKLLNYLDRRLSKLVPEKNERKKFVLAAYNIGLAHILDAINLTEKYGKDPTIWHNNVEFYLLAKSQPEYYNDSIVKYGRISGKETHQFVLNVMDKYEHYKTLALK